MSLPGVGPVRYSHYLLPFLVSGAVSLTLAVYVVRESRARLSERTVTALVALLVGAAGWASAYLLQVAHVEPADKLVWLLLGYPFSSLLPIAWVVIAAEYADVGHWFTRRRLALLAVEPVAVILLVVTNDVHQLVWTTHGVLDLGPLVVLERSFGPGMGVHVLYNYALLAVGSALFVRAFRSAEGPYRGQAAALLGMVVAPLAGNLLFWTDLAVVSRLDFSSAGFTVTGVLLVTAIFRYQVLDLTPIGYSTAIRNIDDLYVVLDRDHQLVDLNPAAREFVGVGAVPIGRPAAAVLPFDPTELTTGDTAASARHDLEIETDEGIRHFDVRVAPIGEAELLGWTLVLRDVTVRREHARELEAKNERLETFSSIVSHDLRNPLNVAQGRLQLLETDDEETRELIEGALDRMEDIVEDTLLLLREGQEVGDPQPMALSTAAERAWGTVDTGAATLDVDGEVTFRADPSRLGNLFENLFRNSVEHGHSARQDALAGSGSADGSLAVRVGPLDDRAGFYVADDGPGIPAEEREEVFDLGYSTVDGGTGFGLNIVRGIAEAHGWEITATEGREGGARFEITGVTTGERS